MQEGAGGEAEAVDFEPEDDDLMDEDAAPDLDAPPSHSQQPKLKSAITAAPKKTKGRGFRHDTSSADHHNNRPSADHFHSLSTAGGPGPQRCISLSLSCQLGFLFFLIINVS